MDKETILRNAMEVMNAVSSLNFAKMYKVFFPRPVIYTFDPNGDLVCFVWESDFDRNHGKYASNNLSNIIKCDALVYEEHQDDTAKLRQDGHYLSINKRALWEILRYHAASEQDNAFDSDDLELFFEKSSNALNDADQWMGAFADELLRNHPEKLQTRT
jgi:hypothetical protein